MLLLEQKLKFLCWGQWLLLLLKWLVWAIVLLYCCILEGS